MGQGSTLQHVCNLQAREELFAEFGLWFMSDDEFPKEEIFSVVYNGMVAYPTFQFDKEFNPLPVIKEVLSIFDDALQGWEVALWFTADNSWLEGGVRPVDVLLTSPHDVVEAARGAVVDIPE